REAEAAARGKTIALKIFVSDAPGGTSGCSEHQFLDRNAMETDSRDIPEIVIAFDEVGVQGQEIQEEGKI
ncbi:MAG: hypothetical protein DMG40_00030, partial [Acidobacteria bacterium]